VEWRKLHEEELNDLYSSPTIVRVIKSRRMKWAGHLARMGNDDDDDYDLQWVRALTLPKTIGLIDRPFLSRNLISAFESPVPLIKFQMALRHKILTPSGSKKRTQIYLHYSLEVATSESPPDSPTGPL
jgi:hypothetical protein